MNKEDLHITEEPTEAFPYSPPTDHIKERYRHIFELSEQLPPRFFKTLFDKLMALILLFVSLPILLLLKTAYLLEGFLIPENKGDMLFYYWGISAGKKIKKWKLRLIKSQYIEPEGGRVMIGLLFQLNGRQIVALW